MKFGSKVCVRVPIMVGIGLIPLVIHPIDKGIHYLMEKYLRPSYPVKLIEKEDEH